MINRTFFDYDWSTPVPLEYYYADGRHVKFEKYEIYIWGEVVHKQRQTSLSYKVNSAGYHIVSLYRDSLKPYQISVSRAVLSNFYGRPEKSFTADHIDSTNKNYDALYELRWASNKQQGFNRCLPVDNKSSIVIVKGCVEKTAREWAESECVSMECVRSRARNKTHGFSYKVYPDLPGEIWKIIEGSVTKAGYWEISNMNRCAYLYTHARNVIDRERMCLTSNGYPTIAVKSKNELVHVLSFRTWFPDLWSNKKSNDVVCHRFDNKLDFRPENLYLGTFSKKGKDAHDNGRFDGGKSKRRGCNSYVNGEFEKHHTSIHAAGEYLKNIGFTQKKYSSIGLALDSKTGDKPVFFGRTWIPDEK